MSLRQEILKKLGTKPYRFTSEVIWRATEKATWTEVDRELEVMMVEGLVRSQNGVWVRNDRLFTTPPSKDPKPKKPNPRQGGFGFE